MDWFNVDKQGLAKLLERKGKQFVLSELLSNAWDEQSTLVEATLNRIPGTKYVEIKVVDDSPNGFTDLSHAFTLFADSAKKSHAEKRGRFNLGEKLILALCEDAKIVSTTGGIAFDAGGRRSLRTRTERGSVFTGRLRMTTAELEDCHASAAQLLPPEGVATFYNGRRLATRACVVTFTAPLATEVADVEGILRKTTRIGAVQILEPLPGEVPMLFEMGVPVVETGNRWHANVTIKIPLTFDRDNVPPAYLSRMRALMLEHTVGLLTEQDVNAPWVREAVHKHAGELESATITTVMKLRFGNKAVAYDPSDPEANQLAVSEGYAVIHGGQMSGAEWSAVRRSGALLPAGQVTPSPKPYSEDGDALKILPPSKWTADMHKVVAYIMGLAPHLIGRPIANVQIANDAQWPFAATYGPETGLTLNAGRLGHRWFGGPLRLINDLLIHELGHHYCSNHLSSDYYKALTSLGARMVDLALSKPGLFEQRACETRPQVSAAPAAATKP